MSSIIPFAYRIPQACTAMGIGRTKIYQLIDAGSLKPIRVGRRVLILRSEVEAFLASLQACPESAPMAAVQGSVRKGGIEE